MNRLIKTLCLVLVVFAFFAQDGYAFWGRKRAPKSEPEVEENIPAEAAVTPSKKTPKVVEKEIKEEIKKETMEEKKEEAVEKKPKEKESKSTDIQQKIKEDKILRQKKRQQLDNTAWEIEITAIGTKEKAQTDSLIFEDNRFYSDRSSREGFNATNYTISIKDEDTVVWETMQTAEDGRINFWRGEISEDMEEMRGVASKKLPDGTSVNYSFTSINKKAVK